MVLQHEGDGLRRTTSFEQCRTRFARPLRPKKSKPGQGRAKFTPFLALFIASGWPAPSAVAETTRRDLQILVRAMGFMERPLSGAADVGIVYPQQLDSGCAEAVRLAATFGDELRAGGLLLRPELVTTEAAGQAEAATLLLTNATIPQAARVAASVTGRSALTVASDRSLVGAGPVVMVVRGGPGGEILVSRAAAQVAGVNFAAAFRMMGQER